MFEEKHSSWYSINHEFSIENRLTIALDQPKFRVKGDSGCSDGEACQALEDESLLQVASVRGVLLSLPLRT
jgi:hypothetical protein